MFCVSNASDTYGATGIAINSDVRVHPIEKLEDLSNIATDIMAQALVDDDATALNNVVTAVTSFSTLPTAATLLPTVRTSTERIATPLGF